MPPPRCSVYRAWCVSGAAGVKVSVSPSADQLQVPWTTGPVTSPSWSAAYCSMPMRIACENSITTGALGSTLVVPPAGPPGFLQLIIEPCQGRLHTQRSPDGAFRVVLVGYRQAKHRHDCVADIFFDQPAKGL